MKRLWKPLLCLLLAALTLSGCSGQPIRHRAVPGSDAGPGSCHPDPGAHRAGARNRSVYGGCRQRSRNGGCLCPQSIFDTNPYDVALENSFTEQMP